MWRKIWSYREGINEPITTILKEKRFTYKTENPVYKKTENLIDQEK